MIAPTTTISSSFRRTLPTTGALGLAATRILRGGRGVGCLVGCQQVASGPAVISGSRRRLRAGGDCAKGIRDGQAMLPRRTARSPRSRGPPPDLRTRTHSRPWHACLHIIEVAPRVAAVRTVVAEHEEVAGGDDDVELDRRRLGRYAVGSGVQVGRLVQRLAVHRDPTLGVAADQMVAGKADDPLDQMLGAGVGQHADELEDLADRPAFLALGAGEPAARVLEDDDFAAFGGELSFSTRTRSSISSVFSIEIRRDQEHLPDETAKQ